MKRALCLISSMNAGGAETFMMKMFRKINRDLYQIDFCVCTNPNDKGFYDDEIIELGGRIFHIPAKSADIFQYIKSLSNVVSSNNYEIVLRITSNAMGFMDLAIAKKAGAKKCIARSSNSSDGGTLKAKISHYFGKILFERYLDIKMAPSDLAAIYSFGKKEYEKGNVVIVENAVELQEYKFSEISRESIRSEFHIDKSEFVIGNVGRFNEQKNHSYILDIFCDILLNIPNARLLLVGKGILKDNIAEKAKNLGIEDKVIFAGQRKDIPALLSAMDVFLFPSLYEGMPNTVIEAQVSGLKCFISNTITKSADITGLVSYLPIDCASCIWSKKIIESGISDQTMRDSYYYSLIGTNYDINKTVKVFQSLVFGEQNELHN